MQPRVDSSSSKDRDLDEPHRRRRECSRISFSVIEDSGMRSSSAEEQRRRQRQQQQPNRRIFFSKNGHAILPRRRRRRRLPLRRRRRTGSDGVEREPCSEKSAGLPPRRQRETFARPPPPRCSTIFRGTSGKISTERGCSVTRAAAAAVTEETAEREREREKHATATIRNGINAAICRLRRCCFAGRAPQVISTNFLGDGGGGGGGGDDLLAAALHHF